MSSQALRRPQPFPGLVAIVAYDGLCTFEFGVAVEVFALPRPEFDFPWYQCEVVAAEGRRARAMGGIVVEARHGLRRLAEARTIVVPGWRNPAERPPKPLLAALAAASAHGARCLSICSGVFVLAAAGLLDHKKATTHWRHVPMLKSLYPTITVAEDVLYVDEGNVITSAGSAAGIDACVHLVRRDFGSRIANSVARRLVMAPHRHGGQAQYVVAPVPQQPESGIAEVMDWARRRLAHPLSIRALAKRAAMSERTLLRRFQEGVGMTPGAWLDRERVVRAQEILESTMLTLGEVAEQCGYRSLETFRVAFKRQLGIPPAAYRQNFRGSSRPILVSEERRARAGHHTA